MDPTPLAPSKGGQELTRWFTRQIWESLGEQSSDVDSLQVSGDGDLGTPFPIADLAAASFAVSGLSVASLLEASGLDAPAVAVDRPESVAWFDVPLAPTRYIDEPEQHGIHSRWMAEYLTADDRWVRVQASFPSLRRRMCEALGVPEDPDDVARACRAESAEALESRLVRAGAVAAFGRSLAEWRESDQGRAVANEPIADLRATTSRSARWSPHPLRPLLGVRVLDMTRVVAAPMATRFLAALGAEVLRLDPPDGDEVTMMKANDIVLGKRWAVLDAKTPEGRERYRQLLASADVFVHGYRPGALDALGYDADARAEISPGLVEVTLDAYGWTGPLSHRRGFDTVLQFASGLAHEHARWANEDPDHRLPLNSLGHRVDGSRPRILPVEILDFSTGYQLAAAAINGLRRQLVTGQGSVTKFSLARTSTLLAQPEFTAGAAVIELPLSLPTGTRVHEMNRRPSRRLDFPFRVDGVDLYWDRPAEDAGSSAPQWATTRPGPHQ
ncbi:CoA transferase [Cryptosporangium aurantiacum]|uniref:CoA-transferase family III n=1 Tax=Cryptosporangium aurantiacum TaxID=134849 RepID=A0A1M7RNX2_9ACTN|nr:CoA transferase [Cryptosporangium aurantiacum]SHN47919.1 CoA-transferase family III [Cryptosporangium aurantiacum]